MCLRRSKKIIRWSLNNVIYDPNLITEELVNEFYRMAKIQGKKSIRFLADVRFAGMELRQITLTGSLKSVFLP